VTDVLVDTAAGRLRGRKEDGVTTFLGVRYGTASRFRAPAAPAGWPGVRDAVEFGPPSPQIGGGDVSYAQAPPEMKRMGLGERSRLPASEDCLVLNVWTPAADSARRPVLVWFHGGGYTGLSAAHDLWNFSNLARRGDVVAIGVNHRLGPLGYFHLEGRGGEQYPDSANAGTLDLVAALGWVRRNVEAFGGDPGNVTIFGQSGGAHKVASLLAMPAAEGLFHRAVMISPPGAEAKTPEEGSAAARRLLDALGLGEARLDELASLPVQRVIDAGDELLRSFSGDPLRAVLAWWPTIDGRNLSTHPRVAVESGASATVPLLIGSTATERLGEPLDEPPDGDGEAWLRARLSGLAAGTAGLGARYRDQHPGESVQALLKIILGHHDFWIPTLRFAEAKLAGGSAPVFAYLFAKGDPSLGARPVAPHNWDMPFLFDTIDHVPAAQIPGAERLAAQASGALLSFAHTGDPGWPAYSIEERATMVFDDECRVENDPGEKERRLWDGIPATGPV
jgi:para-nitrobenzyl esterase